MAFVDPLLGKVLTDQVKKSGLSDRVAQAEINIQTILNGGVPVQGSFVCGEWTDWGKSVINFAAWTVA